MKTEVEAKELLEIYTQIGLALGYSLTKHPDFPDRCTFLSNVDVSEKLRVEQKFNDEHGGSMLSVLKEEALEFASCYVKGNYSEAEKEGYHVMAVAARMVLAARQKKNLVGQN